MGACPPVSTKVCEDSVGPRLCECMRRARYVARVRVAITLSRRRALKLELSTHGQATPSTWKPLTGPLPELHVPSCNGAANFLSAIAARADNPRHLEHIREELEAQASLRGLDDVEPSCLAWFGRCSRDK